MEPSDHSAPATHMFGRMPVGNRIRTLSVCIAALSAWVAAGCARPKAEPWSPRPRVTWDRLCTQPVPFPDNGWRLVSDRASEGRFPSSLAVSRVVLRDRDDREIRHGAYIPAKPKNEYLQWNAAFDDQMALSEVFPIAQRDLGGGPATPDLIVAACRALHARLALIYSLNELSPTQAEMIGVLYETTTGGPIATFHADATSIPPGPDEKPEEIDPWDHDARALVRARFERHVYDCVRTLILQDTATTEEVPAGWVPATPTRPVEWPPREFPARSYKP